jgi:hypothetical protein
VAAGADWASEPKWDGHHLVAGIDAGRARCCARHRTELTSRVGAFADELVELLSDRSVTDVSSSRWRPGRAAGQVRTLTLTRTIFGRGADDASSSSTHRSWRATSLRGRPWDRRDALEAAQPAPTARTIVMNVFDADDPALHARLLALGSQDSVLKRRDERCPPAGDQAVRKRRF